MPHFTRLELRTTDVAAARTFYAGVLGQAPEAIVDLPAPARARGAPSHWLGFVGVADVSSAEAALVAKGASRLGPPGSGPATLRDAGGAVFGLDPATAGQPPPSSVSWYQLHTAGGEKVGEVYAQAFGWALTRVVDLGALGRYRRFTFQAGGEDAGSIGDTAGRPELHAHWCFYFRVDHLQRALEQVVRGGGKLIGPAMTVGDMRVAVCEDAQGAEFGLST